MDKAHNADFDDMDPDGAAEPEDRAAVKAPVRGMTVEPGASSALLLCTVKI